MSEQYQRGSGDGGGSGGGRGGVLDIIFDSDRSLYYCSLFKTLY